MAVIVYTTDPRGLLAAIREAIQAQSIRTWQVDSDGDFTHTAEQWENRSWMRPRVLEDRLVFNILAPRGVQISRATYGVYHGRFIEMLVTHFDSRLERAVATALATSNDVIGSPE
ncbi:MAG TPA: hypothetical protein VF875_01505 [Anaeromyxobacter sp.]